MKYILKLALILGILFAFAGCDKPLPISCEDGIMNQNEEGVDCGGSCLPCNGGFSCSDGVQNGTEIGVDCGGECLPCFPLQNLCSDGIQNNGEDGVDCGGSCSLICNLCTPSQDNVLYGYTYNISDCEFDASSGLYEIEGSAGFGGPILNIKIRSPNTPPTTGGYIVRSTTSYAEAITIRVTYTFGQDVYAISGEEVYIIDNDPMTIVMCDVDFTGIFSFTTSSRIICN